MRMLQTIQRDAKRRQLINELTELKISNDIATKQAHSCQYIDLKNLYNRLHENHGIKTLKGQLAFIKVNCSRNMNTTKN